MQQKNDTFELYNIRVETIRCQSKKRMVCNHPIGSYFTVCGENLVIPNDKPFPLYPLAALLPLVPAKQRITHPNDWMTTDQEVACPDPNCGGVFKISRVGTTVFKHSEVTYVQT